MIKEWNDETTWDEIVKLAKKPNARIRVCSNCGAQAKRWAHVCEECDCRLPCTYKNRHPRTESGEKRQQAQARILGAMRGPACVCGLHGPHECTRTTEWKQGTLALLAARQL